MEINIDKLLKSMITEFKRNKDNFIPIKWEDVVEGQEVFFAGTHLGEFLAYGPHWIYEIKQRRLINSQGRTFMDWIEDLLVKIPHE